MRIFFCSILILCLTMSVKAQKVYYIYLQTDNGSTFYVRMADKIYSSSTSGYVIISNLVDSTYNLSLGFPSDQAESKFNVPLNNKDRGFLIKNLDNEWVLFDLQTSAVIHPEKDKSKGNISYERRDDPFTAMLAKAASDSSLLYVPVAVKQDVAEKPAKQDVVENKEVNKEKKEVVNPEDLKTGDVTKTKVIEEAVKTDTVAIKPTQTDVAVDTKKTEHPPEEAKENKPQEKKDTTATASITKDTSAASLAVTPPKVPDTIVASTPPLDYKRSVVKKHSESSTSEGFGLVFYDKQPEGTDTIKLLIPNPKFSFRQSNIDTQQDTSMFLNVQKTPEVNKDSAQGQPTGVLKPVKPACASVASEKDFFRLRRDMAAKSSDDAMVDEAKKYFKSKCFSTEQVKNLSVLFLTSAGKYQFFDAAYMHVTDQQQFASLQSEIKDDYYLKRFKSLIGE